MKKNIPTKARPIQMNAETVEFCKKEISDLLEKKLFLFIYFYFYNKLGKV